MKKLIFVLAIALMASPVLALSVYLDLTGSNVVNVKYSGADTANLPRAFALDLTITGGSFTSFVGGSYYQGESTAANPKYGIYPAAIVIDSAGAVSDYGTPLAASDDPGAGAFGTAHVVLEFGSLYVGGPNAPATSGTLCSINFTKGTATQIVMVDEDTYRGGLVLEDGTLGEVDVTLPLGVIVGAPTNPSPTNANPKVTITTDLGWTAGANALTRDVYFGTVTPPPLVSSGQTATTYDTSTMAAAKTYYWKIVEKNGADSNTGPIWSFTTECYGGMADYAAWAEAGKPNCWCQPRQCKGDADGLKQGSSKTGYYYVSASDLTVLQGAWQVKNSPFGPGLTGTQGCADFGHDRQGSSKTGYYRVSASDLTILQNNWQVKQSPFGPSVAPTCTPGNLPSGN